MDYLLSPRGLIYFEDPAEKATGVSNLCNLEKAMPYIIFAPPIESSDYTARPKWKISPDLLSQLQIIDQIYDRATESYPFPPFVLFQAQSVLALEQICRGGHKHLLVFSGKAEPEEFRGLFHRVENFYEEEFDLLLQLSELAGWSYGQSCGDDDWAVDAFVAKEPRVTAEVRTALEQKHFPLQVTAFF
jgi:hypothetical protein